MRQRTATVKGNVCVLRRAEREAESGRKNVYPSDENTVIKIINPMNEIHNGKACVEDLICLVLKADRM